VVLIGHDVDDLAGATFCMGPLVSFCRIAPQLNLVDLTSWSVRDDSTSVVVTTLATRSVPSIPYIGNYRTATAHVITAVIGSGVLALGYAVGTVGLLFFVQERLCFVLVFVTCI